MATKNRPPFSEWLRAELRGRKMSQRLLAEWSGVDHSTISRLVRGGRMPSLATATKLARGLREVEDDADPMRYLDLVMSGSATPTERVWYSLRGDKSLSEARVRQVMEYYLSVRNTTVSVPGQAKPVPAVTRALRSATRELRRSPALRGEPVAASGSRAQRGDRRVAAKSVRR